jgi:biofilm PGA synthesis lipoprotein PgaB
MGYATFLMEEGDFELAAREFSRIIEEFPASPLLDEAQFRLGTAYLLSGRYNDAEVEFRLFLSNFSESPRAPEAASGFMEARARAAEARRQAPARPVIIRPVERPLRAVQVMLFNGRSFAEIEREMRGLRNAGVDTIIVRAFHNRGDRLYPVARSGAGSRGGAFNPGRVEAGVYFNTEHAPVVADILPGLAELAHRNGLRIFAWMTTRYADYGLEERADLACTAVDVDTGRRYRCKGLDLFNETAVRHLESLYGDLARVDIDGILFQDDLVLRHGEGFGVHAEAAFARETGRQLDPGSLYILDGESGRVHYTALFWRWAAWKNKRLLTVAERVRRVVRGERPEAKFAINLMYENLTNPAYALAWLSQDLKESMKTGFDYYSVMAYHRQMATELGVGHAEVRKLIERMVGDATAVVGSPEKVLIKIQTVDWDTGRPLLNSEVVSFIRSVRSTGNVSLAVVPYRSGFPFFELGAGDAMASLP